MILDADLHFTAAAGEGIPATTGGTTTVTVGSKVLDLGKPGNAVGGNELALYVVAVDAGTQTGTADVTAQFTLQTSADGGTAGTWEDLVISPVSTITSATFAKGKRLFRVKLVDGFKRYLRLKSTVVAGASTTMASDAAAKIVSFMTKEQ